MKTIFVHVRLIDPETGLDEIGNLLVEDGRISALGPDVAVPRGAEIVVGNGRTLCPGLIDMQSFAADGAAAAAGGFTSIALQPRARLAIDSVPLADYVVRQGRDNAYARVLPMAAATKGLAGEEITEIGLLREAGAVAFSDGRRAIADAGLMYRLLGYATRFDALIIQHAEEPSLVAGACATDSAFATRLGLPAAPALAEALLIERDLRLVEATGGRYHVGEVTTAAGIELIRRAKARGLKVSAGVTPPYFMLNEQAIGDYRTFARFSPPLREEADRLAVVEAIKDGVIEVIASGHDPNTEEDKRLPFAQAAPGAVGLETALALALSLYHAWGIALPKLLATLTINPARLLGLDCGRLCPGAPADLLLFDPDAPWRIAADAFKSAAKNTPFDGLPVQGKISATFLSGKRVSP